MALDRILHGNLPVRSQDEATADYKAARQAEYQMLDIAALRDMLKITSRDLAELLNVTERTIYAWQKDPSEITGSTVPLLIWLRADRGIALAKLRKINSARRLQNFSSLLQKIDDGSTIVGAVKGKSSASYVPPDDITS